jgi:putative transposase
MTALYGDFKRTLAKPISYYANRYKDTKEAIVCAFQSGAYTMKEIPEFFNVHYATVSRAARRAEKSG